MVEPEVDLPAPQLLQFKDDVFVRDHIVTAEKSVVRVLLGGKALVTVRELSSLTIKEETGRSTVDLTAGKIAMGVAMKTREAEYAKIGEPQPGDEIQGEWTRTRLVAMNEKFATRLQRAIASGQEHEPDAK